ncbi:MAG TPA: response regulator [Gemmatimonadaceae bacterium]|nr:response regulator [Gemmatimonadaceae bacterium]
MIKRKRVLIADDDRILTQMLSSRLQTLGWVVDVALDAMQAVMFTRQHAPDIIVLDIAMPGGTGRQALHSLKASSKLRAVPVVVLSGSVDPDEESKMVALGAVEFLRKPIDPDVLDARLRAVLGEDAAA